MTRLAVIGPGLLGGSIALAARRAGGFHIALWARREEAVAEIQAARLADVASCDLRIVAADADIVVLCVPIGAMAGLARELAAMVSAGALITDVGSVKAPVVSELRLIFRECGRFVGSHPMAGSDQTGLRSARAGLFDGAVCIVTPDEFSDPAAVQTVGSFWETLGCRVRHLAPAEHDEVVALASHLPHAAAAAMMHAVAAANPAAFDFIGPGFRDTTRVAGGSPAMWTEIFAANRSAVRKSAEAMIEKLREFITLLDRTDASGDTSMNAFLTQAKTCRDRLRLPTSEV